MYEQCYGNMIYKINMVAFFIAPDIEYEVNYQQLTCGNVQRYSGFTGVVRLCE